ncbi:hypothetical protein RB195_005121 [Necator americanus]|uniref:Frizzled/Smoothened transmembrane domain-containing protein n=1 Tax=Necator americanus TaxID=51031 RepID=A0ABR1BP97_NECAM
MMGSPALETVSPTNSLVRRVRRADAVGRLRARSDHYLWFFGQVHAKRLLVFAHFMLLVVSMVLMWEAGAAGFTGLPIPGLDGFSPFEVHNLRHSERLQEQESDSIYVSTSSSVPKPYLYLSKNVVSTLGYLYLFSTIMGFLAMRVVDGLWQRDGGSPLFFVNPALLLLPFLLSVLSMGGALFLWSIKNGKMQAFLISEVAPEDSLALAVIDAIRFTYLPCLLMWTLYSYFFYGCALGFMCAYRRAQQWRSQKCGVAPASLSWSFRERPLLHRSTERSSTRHGFLSRLSANNRSWHSYKSTDNPTLRGYVKKSDEDGCPSLLSEEINLSFGSESSENNNLSRSFCAINMSRRPLDTPQIHRKQPQGCSREFFLDDDGRGWFLEHSNANK